MPSSSACAWWTSGKAANDRVVCRTTIRSKKESARTVLPPQASVAQSRSVLPRDPNQIKASRGGIIGNALRDFTWRTRSRHQPAAGKVQLSILMATNRPGLLACSRIAQACSWAGPNIEVIVRDNSGNLRKRDLLAHFCNENCKIIIADPCDGLANFSEILKMATGEFVFLLADDDFCFDHAIAALPSVIAQNASEAGVVGLTGLYAIEASRGSSIVSYQDVDSDDVVRRLTAFLSYEGPNVLHYAPVRTDLVRRIFNFIHTFPFYFSFHDQIVCMLYLLNGRFARINRLLYLYDVGVWQAAETAQKKDIDFYKDAGLDPAINKLHWFLCGFEGAVLIRNSDIFPVVTLAQRQSMADQWFSTMYHRFKGQPRYTFGSLYADEAEKLCAKLRSATGQLSFHEVLTAISGFIALFSKAHGQTYFDFWDAILNKRQPVPREAAPPRLAAAGGV